MSLSVMVVANFSATFGGNIIESFVALQNKIVREGGAVVFCFPHGVKQLEWASRLHTIYEANLRSYMEMRQVFYWGKKLYDIQLVHYHFVGGFTGAVCRLAQPHSWATVWHLHNHVDCSNTGWRATLRGFVHHLIYPHSYKIGVSKSVSDSVKRYSSENVCTIYNSISFNRLEQCNAADSFERKDGRVNCLIMGNHYERKGVDIAARAIKLLRKSGVDAILYVSANEQVFPRIASFLDNSVGAGWCHYVRCIPARNDIATYYVNTDIFLSLSREEGWTWAIDEAAYCGCGVVCSNIPGQDENTVPGFCWCGNPNTEDIAEKTVQAIRQVLTRSDEQKARIKDEARAYMLENFAMKRWVQDVLDVYQAALTGCL